MFESASYTSSGVFVGILVAILIIVLILLNNTFVFKRKHTSLSYAVAVAFTIILVVFIVLFGGLINTKSDIDNCQYSYEYQLIQRGNDLLSQESDEMANILSFVGLDQIDNSMRYQREKVIKYLWFDGALCIISIIVCIGLIYKTSKE